MIGVQAQNDQKTETKEERKQRYIDEVNPFKKLGYKPKIATLSKGKYREAFPDTIVKIGSFTYNVLSKQVTGVQVFENLGLSEADLKPEIVSRWMSPDPLSDEFPDVSPYNFVNNNPIRFIDPLGLAPEDIIGKTKKDAEKAHNDLNTIFAGNQFTDLRGLLTRGKNNNKKQFDKIDAKALEGALSGLKGDDLALAEAVTDAINSNDQHIVEFVNVSDNVSKEGTAAFKKHIDRTLGAGKGDKFVPAGTQMKGTLLNSMSGGGLNIPENGGSHTLIAEGKGVSHSGGRAVTTGHEIIGHGVAGANNILKVPNNTRAIRVDNLIRRVMGIKTFRTQHGGATIVKPHQLPRRIK
ncbi:RHS repeat domain-containing protein [Seonamhaeicola marinus]|uniref:RHS repeat-associated core domain-containing protein n=1 Tax=Seonamhaeicola marinus TaxID=1912246 RepID=A0A5D0HUH3_9FLAO|nr:hypothetical protein [Seonamhaeicola marinus]TYA74956.1 hypothetical protein FUA24_16790 [Seonamhaeicola marinus]